MGSALDLEAGVFHTADQCRHPVPTPMEERLVVAIVQALARGHLDDHGATRLEDAMELRQRGRVVLDVLEHVQEHRRVDTCRRQRALGQIELQERHVPREALSRLFQCAERVVRADKRRLGQPGDHLVEQEARRNSHFEDHRTGPARDPHHFTHGVGPRRHVDEMIGAGRGFVQVREVIGPARGRGAVREDPTGLAAHREGRPGPARRGRARRRREIQAGRSAHRHAR